MSYAESLQWRAYLMKRGSVHHGRRLESGLAQIASAVWRLVGKKDAQPRDYMPYEFPAEDHVATPEEVMSILRSARKD